MTTGEADGVCVIVDVPVCVCVMVGEGVGDSESVPDGEGEEVDVGDRCAPAGDARRRRKRRGSRGAVSTRRGGARSCARPRRWRAGMRATRTNVDSSECSTLRILIRLSVVP